MQYLFVNLKRFDISPGHGGVNDLAPMNTWASLIAATLHAGLEARKALLGETSVAAFFPEAHLLGAAASIPPAGRLRLGCQGVHIADTAPGGDFGAFTGQRTANAARELGCDWVLVGHSEERRHLAGLMARAGASPEAAARATGELLNLEARCAASAGLKVLFCVGERAEELPLRARVLEGQIEAGLAGVGGTELVLAYEPVWAIGPGKTPPDAGTIGRIAAEIKEMSPLPLVYGGGLKLENAESIGALPSLDGGLVALTRFTGRIGFDPADFLAIADAYLRGRARAGGMS